MSSLRQRNIKKKSKAKKISQAQSSKSRTKAVPVFPLPLIFRLLIISMFLISLYAFKHYYQLQHSHTIDNNNVDTTTTKSDPDDIDFTQIITSHDLNLSKTKLKAISPRFSAKKKKTVPRLRYWQMDAFWTKEMALNISNQIYDEFMDENKRKESFYFTINRGNEKIRGNENISQKILDAHSLHQQNRFSYCKYEYRRQLPLYQRVLSYLNSSYVTSIMSKVLKKEILGVSDLFISVFYKDNFLSMHDDRGLGHYAFVNFLSKDWSADEYGGSLNFNCQNREHWRESCFEMKFEFNQNVLFRVWPEHIPHFVKRVTVNKPRIAITGWYFTPEQKGLHWASIMEETGYGLQ